MRSISEFPRLPQQHLAQQPRVAQRVVVESQREDGAVVLRYHDYIQAPVKKRSRMQQKIHASSR